MTNDDESFNDHADNGPRTLESVRNGAERQQSFPCSRLPFSDEQHACEPITTSLPGFRYMVGESLERSWNRSPGRYDQLGTVV